MKSVKITTTTIRNTYYKNMKQQFAQFEKYHKGLANIFISRNSILFWTLQKSFLKKYGTNALKLNNI